MAWTELLPPPVLGHSPDTASKRWLQVQALPGSPCSPTSKLPKPVTGVLRPTPARLRAWGQGRQAVWTLGFALIGFGVVVIAIMGGTSLFAGDTQALELPHIAAWLAFGALSLGAACIAITVWRDRIEAAAMPDERPNRQTPDSN